MFTSFLFTMETQDQKTIRGVFLQKLLTWIENNSLKSIVRKSISYFVILSLTMIWIDPKMTSKILLDIISSNSYLMPKFAFSFLVVRNSHTIIAKAKEACKIFRGKGKNTLEGIPISEILDHLFMVKTFSRDQIVDKFGISRKNFESLSKKLEDVDVLVRGEKNAKILNDNYSRSDIASMIQGKKKSSEIQTLFRRYGNSYKSEPTAKEIKNRVDDYIEVIPPAPGFVMKRIC